MTTTRRSPPEETKIITLPLFLVTLPKTPKSQIFRLPSLCHIAIRVEAYRNQSSLTQCHNCQQFGHVWANCKQPPRCLWCGGGHLHNECPEKEKASSTPACCNCRLADGDKPHFANYRGCSHAKEELQKKLQRAPKTTTGRVFSSVRTTPGVSFAAALRGSGDQQQQPQANQVPVATLPTKVKHNTPAHALQQTTGQSVQAPNVSSHPFDNMLKV
jgi:hypothetical protein